MNKVTVVVTFLQGETITFTDKPFLEVIKSTFSEKFEELVPIKIYFPKTEKTLYADKNIFMSLLNDDISTEDAVAATQCDNLCRNNIDFTHLNGDVYADAGSLWKINGNNLVLVDDDRDIIDYWNEKLFTIV